MTVTERAAPDVAAARAPRSDCDVIDPPWAMKDVDLDKAIDEDHKRTRRSAFYTSVAFVVTAAALAATAVAGTGPKEEAARLPILIIACFCLLAGLIVPQVLFVFHRARGRKWSQLHAESRNLDAATRQIHNPQLGRLMLFNFHLMDRFTNIPLGQAQAAYVASSVAAAVALLVLLAGTAAILGATGLGVQIAAGTLTAAGVTLSSFLSFTFLRTFAMTSKQMSYYYGQPLVHCYLLHAEWLAARSPAADAELRDRVHGDLIHAAIKASQNAQHQLLDLQRLNSQDTAWTPGGTRNPVT